MVCVGLGVGGARGVRCWLCVLPLPLFASNLWHRTEIASAIWSSKCGEQRRRANPKFSERSGKSKLREGGSQKEGGFAGMSGGCRETRLVGDGAADSGRLASFPHNHQEDEARDPGGEPPRMAHTQGKQMSRSTCLCHQNEGPGGQGYFCVLTAALQARDTY